VNTDGSIRRVITSSFRIGAVSWTRDGNYILGAGLLDFALYNARDGMELPIPALFTAHAASVR